MGKPFLYDVVDKLYHGVIDNAPKALQERDCASAFVLGSAGIFGVVKGLQLTSRYVMNNVIPNFHEKVLPKLEKACIVGMAAAPVLYAALNPKAAKRIIKEHPTYTSGMAGVYLGSIAGAVQDLHERSIEERAPE